MDCPQKAMLSQNEKAFPQPAVSPFFFACVDDERLWRSVKYEEVYLYDYEGVPQAIKGLGKYFNFYNRERLHQSLNYKTPEAVRQRRPA
jgi:hypothetical protein